MIPNRSKDFRLSKHLSAKPACLYCQDTDTHLKRSASPRRDRPRYNSFHLMFLPSSRFGDTSRIHPDPDHIAVTDNPRPCLMACIQSLHSSHSLAPHRCRGKVASRPRGGRAS